MLALVASLGHLKIWALFTYGYNEPAHPWPREGVPSLTQANDIAPLTTTVFDSSDPALSGLASGNNNAVARTAGLLAIALFGIVFSGVFASGFEGRLQEAHVSPRTQHLALAERARFAGGTVPADVPAADRPAVTDAVKHGVLAGFRGVQYVSAAVSFLAALIAFFALPAGRTRAYKPTRLSDPSPA